MEKSNKFNEFAMLRAIGALAVITIHTTSTFGEFNSTSFSYLFFGIINKFCNFAVPLFLFLSIVLLIKNSLEKNQLNIGEFYKKRFLKTVPVFLVYIAIYYFYLKFFNNSKLISPIHDPLNFFTTYILQGSIYYHLYFMPIIFQLYILFPIIYFCTKKIKNIRIHPILSFILTFGILILLQFAFQQVHKYYIWPHFQRPAIILLTYLLPVGMGIWVGSNYEFFKNSKIIKILALIVASISGYFLIRYTLFPTIRLHNLVLPIYTSSVSIVLLSISILLANKTKLLKQILYKISVHSLTIYLIHPLILNIYRKVIKTIEITNSAFINNSINTIVRFTVVLGLSYLFAVIVLKVKEKICLIYNHTKTQSTS